VERSGDFPKERFRARAFTSNGKRDATTSRAEIDRGRRGQIHAVRANILRYADNFEPGAILALPNPLPKRIGRVAPILASHVLGYQHDAAVVANILPSEIAPAYQSRTLRLEEAG